jgi:hypothetical protein
MPDAAVKAYLAGAMGDEVACLSFARGAWPGVALVAAPGLLLVVEVQTKRSGRSLAITTRTARRIARRRVPRSASRHGIRPTIAATISIRHATAIVADNAILALRIGLVLLGFATSHVVRCPYV